MKTQHIDHSNQDEPLNLKPPTTIASLPEGIIGKQVGNLRLFTTRDVASFIAAEESLRWQSIRHWMYEKIKFGEITVFKFNGIELLDEDGVKTLRHLRSHLYIKNSRKVPVNRKIITIPEGQLLTIKDVASSTGKGVGKIRKMIKNKTIRPKFRDRCLIFDSKVIEEIASFPPQAKGRKNSMQFNVQIKRLTPLTEKERFVLEVRERQSPPFSWRQITEMASEAGLRKTKSKNQNWSRNLYLRAVKKRELLNQDPASLPLRARGRYQRAHFDFQIKRLTPLTEKERFVLEARERESPPFSWRQITDMALEAGLRKTKAKRGGWAQQIYYRAVKKKELLRETRIDARPA
jgi:hypothetical protein